MIIGRPHAFALADWLEQELVRAALAMPFAVLDALAAMGVPRGVLADLTSVGDLGRCRVIEQDGRWRPAEEGEAGPPRLILAVRDGAGNLLDLAALSSVDLDLWSLRTGDGAILGADLLDELMGLPPLGRGEAKRRARLYARPIDLLAHGGAGFCVLDWRPAALTTLRLLGPSVALIADNAAAAKRLGELLAVASLPEVTSQTGERLSA